MTGHIARLLRWAADKLDPDRMPAEPPPRCGWWYGNQFYPTSSPESWQSIGEDFRRIT
jgi:hypothetical protein